MGFVVLPYSSRALAMDWLCDHVDLGTTLGLPLDYLVEGSKLQTKMAVLHSEWRPGYHCCSVLLRGHLDVFLGKVLLPY